MSVSLSHKDRILDESSRPADKRKAMTGAIIFLILLLLIIFWRFFSKLDPLPEPGGLMASFGNVEIAGGSTSEKNSENTKSVPTPADTKMDKVATDDNIKSSALKTEPTPKTPTNTKTSEPKTDEGPKGVNADDYFKGSGKGADKGKQGTPDGKKDDLGNIGTKGEGDAKGDGIEEGSGGRKCVGNCSSCSVSGNWNEVGDAYVSITIDAKGKVIEAILADSKKYPTNAQFYGAQKRDAAECARQRRYEPSFSTSKQVVRISFRKI